MRFKLITLKVEDKQEKTLFLSMVLVLFSVLSSWRSAGWLNCVTFVAQPLPHVLLRGGAQVHLVRVLQKTASCQRRPPAHRTPQARRDDGLNHLQPQVA